MSDASASIAVSHDPTRIAFAHDWLVARRGGELVLEALLAAAQTLGESTCLYTLFSRDRVSIGPLTDAIDREVSTLSSLPASMRRWLMPLYPLGTAQLGRRLRAQQRTRPVDLLISTSSAAIKAMRPPPGVPHLCYCHSPARYVWARSNDYRAGPRPTISGRARELGLGIIGGPYRRWDRRTARDGRVTAFLANSSHTASQIHRCYGINADVLHPPVRTTFFTPDPTIPRGTHWLVVAALEPYKRIEDAIRAAALAGSPLEIVGTGSDEPRLRALSAEMKADVRWLGHLSDHGVRDAYRRAAVLLFPQIEDFGIVAVEALACGTPIAARRAGGAVDIIDVSAEPSTGVLYDAPTQRGDIRDDDSAARVLVDAANSAVRLVDTDHCRARAEVFSERVFHERACEQIAAMLAREGA